MVPLRFASLAGAIIGAMGLLSLTYTVGGWFFGAVVTGWTSIATILLIIGGVQLLMLGVMGEYLGRLYMESKRRPLFVVDSIVSAPAGGSVRTERTGNMPALSQRLPEEPAHV